MALVGKKYKIADLIYWKQQLPLQENCNGVRPAILSFFEMSTTVYIHYLAETKHFVTFTDKYK